MKISKLKYGIRKLPYGEYGLWLKRKGETINFGLRPTLCRKVTKLLNTLAT